MKRLPISFPDLLKAFEDSGDSRNIPFWFDTLTGKVISETDDLNSNGKFQEKLEHSDKHRFVPIDPIASHDSYEIMADFVAILPHSLIREQFEQALGDWKPFQRFHEILLQNMQLRQQWLDFHDEAVRLYALDWLADLGLQPAEEEEKVEPRITNYRQTWPQEEVEAEKVEEITYYREDLSIEEEAELIALVKQLPGSKFDLSRLHGLLTSWIIGPVSIHPTEFFSLLVDEGKPMAESVEQIQYFLDLLTRFHNRIVLSLDSGTFEPVIYRQGELPEAALQNLTSWGKGFVQGIEHRARDWDKWFADPRRKKAMSLLFEIAQLEVDEAPDESETEQIETRAYDLICTWIPLLRQFWRFEANLDSLPAASSRVESA